MGFKPLGAKVCSDFIKKTDNHKTHKNTFLKGEFHNFRRKSFAGIKAI